MYSYLNPNGSDLEYQLIPIWEESWRAQGWTPRLLTIRDAKKHPDFGKKMPDFVAWAQVGGGWYSKLDTLNFSFLPRQSNFKIESVGDGVLWASRRGVKEFVKNFPYLRNSTEILKKRLVNVFGYECDVAENTLPLVSFSRCKTIEEVQHGVEICLAARKKN